MEKVKKGDKIKISYVGALESGKVFDSTEEKGPVEVVAGDGKLIKAIDEALIGMEVGTEKEIRLSPEQAFGPVKDTLQHTMPRSMVDKINPDPKVGHIVQVEAPDKNIMTGVITSVSDKNIVADFNHPLAGQNVIYKLKVLEICSE